MRRCIICDGVHKHGGKKCKNCIGKLRTLRRALQGDGVVDLQYLNVITSGTYIPAWYNDTKPKMCITCLKNKPRMHTDPICRACKAAGWTAHVV